MDDASIRALIHEYAFRLDAGDLDGVAALFEHAEVGSTVRPERFRGAAQVRRMYDGVRLYDGSPCTMHCMTNVTVTLEGDTARARTYFTVQQGLPDFPLQPIIAGAYHDRFERVEGRWRFAERIIDPRLSGDLSRHMAPGWLPDA